MIAPGEDRNRAEYGKHIDPEAGAERRGQLEPVAHIPCQMTDAVEEVEHHRPREPEQDQPPDDGAAERHERIVSAGPGGDRDQQPRHKDHPQSEADAGDAMGDRGSHGDRPAKYGNKGRKRALMRRGLRGIRHYWLAKSGGSFAPGVEGWTRTSQPRQIPVWREKF